MKTMKFFALLAVLTLATTGCVEKSDKYKSLLAEKDSLQSQKDALQNNYNETIDILNAVDSGFASIRDTEKKVAVGMVGVEGKSTSKKQELVSQIEQIKDVISQNKARLAELQRISARQGQKNSTLAKTIERMQKELDDKESMIATLQDELAKKNIRIGELTNTVDSLNTGLTELNKVSDQQKATIKTQDASMNSVWYVVATSKVLKASNIVTSNGLFRAKSVLEGGYDKSSFIKSDLRTLSTIETKSKKATVLSTHPKGTYKMVKGSDGNMVLEITDHEKFWSVSKYLVVQI